MSLYFQSVRVTFTDGPTLSGEISGTASITFPGAVMITQVEAALKSFTLSYPENEHRYVSAAGARISEVSFNGASASCRVILQLLESSDWLLSRNDSMAEVLFIADCQSLTKEATSRSQLR